MQKLQSVSVLHFGSVRVQPVGNIAKKRLRINKLVYPKPQEDKADCYSHKRWSVTFVAFNSCHHSTMSCPFMLLCPAPHCTEQKNVNFPALSATNSISTVCPGLRRSLTPKSGSAKP